MPQLVLFHKEMQVCTTADPPQTKRGLRREACQLCHEAWLEADLGQTESIPAIRTADLGVISNLHGPEGLTTAAVLVKLLTQACVDCRASQMP